MLGRFFQCDPDIRLAGSEIYLDPAESRKLGIISHGHSDHIGRHEHFVATPATASFLRAREGADLRGTELGFGEIHRIGEYAVDLHPAGHILGSAMVRVTRAGESLLYTGDFRLRPSLTAEAAAPPQCDELIMESTYGSPEWRFPPREQLRDDLLALVRDIVGRGKTLLLLAYSLGKAQEVLAMLAASDLEVVVHPTIARINELYSRHGVETGKSYVWALQQGLWRTRATTKLAGRVVIMPPHLESEIRRVPRRETVMLSGWALHRSFRTARADHALPLSDHADFDELLELVERVRPSVVYVTHGSQKFARELQARGVTAQFLRKKPQMRLF